jgi:putative drug exporter of the RND superfamily
LGKNNWYLPRWLRWIPNISLGESAPASEREGGAGPAVRPQRRNPVLTSLPVPSPVMVENENGSNFPGRRSGHR